MIKIDLITGFLGAGKTTFLIKYAKYLISIGEKICILENDHGAINVDMMLLSSIDCDKEMVAGGCDYQTHIRRFKTKLISMSMRGYTRVIVEPSGIYDTDEFFDTLYEDDIIDKYEIGNVFCIYDFNTKNLSYESEYILASQLCVSSKIIVTKRNNNELVDISYLNDILKRFYSNRIITNNDILYSDQIEMKDINNIGYVTYDHIKIPVSNDSKYKTLYYMDMDINIQMIKRIKDELFNSNEYGSIFRIKGFIYENNKWYKINITSDIVNIDEIIIGQKVIIIIGENINKEKIDRLFQMQF